MSTDENDWKVKTVTAAQQTLSIEQCVAQVHALYIAGFDSTASTVAFTIFEVARNPRVKALLQAEIDRTLEAHNGQLTYESINEMHYLELCFLGRFLFNFIYKPNNIFFFSFRDSSKVSSSSHSKPNLYKRIPSSGY